MRKSFAQSFSEGWNAMTPVAQAIKDYQVGRAANSNQVQEGAAGREQAIDLGNKANSYDSASAGLQMENFDSPEQFAAAEKAYNDAAANARQQASDVLSSGQKAYYVGDRSFANQDQAQSYADGQNLRAMADVYKRQGNPTEALKLRAMGQQIAKGDLEIKDLNRKDKDAEFGSAIDDLIRQSANLSDAEFYSRAAQLGTNGKADNLGFTVRQDPETGQFMGVQHDRTTRMETGQAPLTREGVIQSLLKYSGRDGFEKARLEAKGDQRWDKEFGLKDREVAVKEESNRIHDKYYTGMLGIHGAELGLKRQQIKLGSTQYMTNEDGTVTAVTPTMGKNGVQVTTTPIPGLKLPPKLSGEKAPLDPAARKDFTTALDGLGVRPAPKVGFFGGKDDTAGKQWDAQRQQIYTNHGVPFAGGGNGGINYAPPKSVPGYAEDAPTDVDQAAQDYAAQVLAAAYPDNRRFIPTTPVGSGALNMSYGSVVPRGVR